jgi:hypothetical protein
MKSVEIQSSFWQEHIVSIFRVGPEDGDDMFLPNIG